jgi:hypothetical protein
VPCQRRGLSGDAFHHVSVGGDDVDVMVEGAGALFGVGVEQPAFAACRHRHPHCTCHALSQRPGGDLHASGVPVLGVPGSGRVPGPVRFQIWQFQSVAGQVELDVESKAGVAAGEHEAIPPQPLVACGSCRMTFWNSRYASGARLIAVPG